MIEVNKVIDLWIKNRKLSRNSFRLYELELERFSAWMDFKNLTTDGLTSVVMNEYLECLKFDPEDNRSQFYVRRKKGLSESSIEQSRRILNAFFEWALKNGHMSRNPFWITFNSSTILKNKINELPSPPILSKIVKKVLSTHSYFDDEVNLRFATIAHLAFWVGATREEISQLKIGDFVKEQNVSYILLPFEKGNITARVPIPKQSSLVIQKYLKCRRDQNYLLDSDVALVSSIKSGEFLSGWSIRHILRSWQKEVATEQPTSVVGPRQLRQAFLEIAIRKNIPERVICNHLRVKNLTLRNDRLPNDYSIRLYKAVSSAFRHATI
jgi:site-specific recombinase XerD